MGYPMDYTRVVSRSGLHGEYPPIFDGSLDAMKGMIAGDLRRLERDSRDEAHIKAYAMVAGCTKKQAQAVLDAFFGGCVLLKAAIGNKPTSDSGPE